MERRVEQADGGGQAFQLGEDAGEVLALVGEEFGEGCLTAFEGSGEDHLAHGVDAVALEEHVLRAGESDAGGTERESDAGLFRGVGVGADGEAGGLAAPLHELEEVLKFLGLLGNFISTDDAGDDFAGRGLELAAVNGAGGAVDAHEVALFEGLTGGFDGLLVVVDFQCGSTANAHLAHLAGDECGVGGNPTLGS